MDEKTICDNPEIGNGEAVSEAVPAYKKQYSSTYPIIEGKIYTYEEYRQLPDYIDGIPVRYEMIEGRPYVRGYPDGWSKEIYMMAQPKRKHEKINGELFRQLANFLLDKPCEVYGSNFEVILNPSEADKTTFVPDISVVCDHSKLTDNGCSGAPNFIIEVLSPSTAQHDKLVKMQQYEKYGVLEYWIVEPKSKLVTVHILKDGRYDLVVYDDISKPIPVHVLSGCTIDLSRVFAE